MMSLQDVLDAVGTTPERYGREAWYRDGEPWCPLAVEVLQDEVLSGMDAGLRAAEILGCSIHDIMGFTNWWDVVDPSSRYVLESKGYRFPPDSVRKRAKS